MIINIDQRIAIDTKKISDEAYTTALRIGFMEIMKTNRVAKSIKENVLASQCPKEL